MTPELVVAFGQLITTIGGPLFITIAVLALMWKMLGLMGKQNDILASLSEHTASSQAVGEANAGKLDVIIGKLERGVCREADTEIPEAAGRPVDHHRDLRVGRGGFSDVQGSGSL